MRILFQGDSITDVMRHRENEHYKGMGYATMVSGKLGFEYPGQYEFINRGVSGNRISDLVSRIKMDMINVKPDAMSILIGVNDVWHELNEGNGVDASLFEKLYNLLIEELKTALPNLRIMILEPFVLKGTGTECYLEEFKAEVALRGQIAKKVAEKHGLEFIPLQDRFNEMLAYANEAFWTEDGVHPTAAGHELIAREWIKQFLKNC